MTRHSLETGAGTESATSSKQIGAIYFALVTMMALAGLDQSIVATALPRIGAEFGNMSDLAWVVTAYALASTAVMPLYGKLSDQYGRNRCSILRSSAFWSDRSCAAWRKTCRS